jgi:RNA polymerase sigma-70 factor (sigma-E family)
MVAEPEGFHDFVVGRSGSLLRFAWALTGDWHAAEDLVQSALVKTWPRWSSIRRHDDPEVYVRRVIVNSRTSWLRRRSSSEVPAAQTPERYPDVDTYADVDARECLRRVLMRLPTRQRAVVALRYLDDLAEGQVATILGCSVGTVKSQAAKAIVKLREDPVLRGFIDQEVSR